MRKIFCDIRGCKGEAVVEDINVCVGWTDYIEGFDGKKETFKPFNKPDVRKMDLCEKHYRIWCKFTYNAFFGGIESETR